jgi:hypothetical protein
MVNTPDHIAIFKYKLKKQKLFLYQKQFLDSSNSVVKTEYESSYKNGEYPNVDKVILIDRFLELQTLYKDDLISVEGTLK